jgi:restriction system protein
MTHEDFIDAEKLSLDEWLDLVFNPPKGKLFLRRAFPSDRHRDEYIATIQKRSHDEVRRLLHSFLVKSTSVDIWDELNYSSLLHAYKTDRERFERMFNHTYFRRLANHFKVSKEIYPWEGNTWILDLLPHSPKLALEGLHAYTFAHIPVAPDMVLQGLFDAEEVIRAKYIGLPETQSDKVAALFDLSSRQFEHLTERLYHSMGYDTWLTKPSRDGGRDVIAKINDGARHEFLLVECKRYLGTVDVGIVRELYGVVNSEKANRGVLVTSGKFTPDAQKFADDNSMQLINGDKFVLLLNEHLGANWFQKLARIMTESEQHYLETRKSAKSQKGKRK